MRLALIAVLIGIVLGLPATARETWSLSMGRAVQVGQEGIAGDAFLTARYAGTPILPLGLAPDVVAGAGEAGTAFLSVGLGRAFDVGPARIDLRTGPALYHGGLDGASGDERVQFYSSAGVSVRVGRFRVGVEAAHISNAGLNGASSDTDIVSLTIGRGF